MAGVAGVGQCGGQCYEIYLVASCSYLLVLQDSGSVLAWLFEKLVLVMVAYFVLSIINSMAQSYHKRLCKTKRLLAR